MQIEVKEKKYDGDSYGYVKQYGNIVDLQSPDYYQGKVDALNDTLSLLDTIEMKLDACYERILKLYE